VSQSNRENIALAAGGLSALLASACCLGPLLLVSVGLGGAWVGNLSALEPYRPVFIGAALVAMVFAYRRIYQPVAECAPDEVCARPQTRRAYKLLFWTVSGLVLLALGFPYLAPLFY
jgi:mercuric ion transport protein